MSEANRILLVEDNPSNQAVLNRLFSRTRCGQVTVVGDGQEALRFLRREGEYADCQPPALIVLDLNLPKKNGLEVLREVKCDPVLCGTPIVVFSSSTEHKDILDSYLLHANCYIPKPTNLEKLVEVVEAMQYFWFEVAELPGRRRGL